MGPPPTVKKPHVPRGVHFGEALSQEANERTSPAEGTTDPAIVALSEQLVEALTTLSPILSPYQLTKVGDVLGEVVAAYREAANIHSNLQSDDRGFLPLGSFNLGVMQPGDEVDMLFVAPLSVKLPDLCSSLTKKLEGKVDFGCVFQASPDGALQAPGLSFILRGLRIRLLFAQRVPDLPDPGPEAVVNNVAALCAYDSTEALLAAVPDQDLFRLLLRFVRHWAKQRGIYGGHLGFLGGQAWAICCARICQMHPNAELSELVFLFFRTLSRWDWRTPLTVNKGENSLPDGVPVPVLAYSDPAKKPIIDISLPLFNRLSAAPHVSETTSAILAKEFQRATKMSHHVHVGRTSWPAVVTKADFSNCHKYFLEFDFVAKDEGVLQKWMAWAKQCTNKLVRTFEATSKGTVTLRPWPDFLDFRDAEWPFARALFVGLRIERGDQPEQVRSFLDLREPVVRFLELVSTWPESERYVDRFDLLIKQVRNNDVQTWLDKRERGEVAGDSRQVNAVFPR